MRFPTNSQRLAVIGRTGSGKTQAAAWHLANRDLANSRWVIVDFKRDKLLNSLPGVAETSLAAVPHRRGLYIVHPVPGDEEKVEEYLWSIWSKENTGLFVDEGFMLQKSRAFDAILTQGRSKKIPVIVCTQRPVWVSRFVWSESDYFQVFSLNSQNDYKSVRDFVPYDFREHALPPYCSVYHDVSAARTSILTPAPDAEVIRDFVDAQIGRRLIPV